MAKQVRTVLIVNLQSAHHLANVRRRLVDQAVCRRRLRPWLVVDYVLLVELLMLLLVVRRRAALLLAWLHIVPPLSPSLKAFNFLDLNLLRLLAFALGFRAVVIPVRPVLRFVALFYREGSTILVISLPVGPIIVKIRILLHELRATLLNAMVLRQPALANPEVLAHV